MDRLAKTPKNEGAFLLARRTCCTNREHAIKSISSNGSLWGVSVKKRQTTKRCESVSSALNSDFGCKVGDVQGNGAHDEAGGVF